MTTKKTIIIVSIIVVLGVAYYALSPLFRNVEVQDELPENILEDKESGAQTVSSGFENLSPERQAEMLAQMEAKNAEGPIEASDNMPPSAPPAEVAAATFSVMETLGHPAEGQVRVLNTTDGQVLRYENFKTINGPRLHVYLAKDLEAREFIDLGPIRGTEGNINYAVPEDTDLSEYRYVMHWCVPFGVLFNYADLAAS